MLKKDIKAITIGKFDGLHVAHQKLINELGKNGGVVVINTDYKKLTPDECKNEIAGIPCFCYELRKIKDFDAKDFIKCLEKEFPNLEKIVVGYDFKFGKDRKFGIKELKEAFSKEVIVIDEVKVDNTTVHSSLIRECLKEHNIKLIEKYLGRKYCIKGKVIKGQGLGSKKLVPTINFTTEFFLPANGVYATRIKIASDFYDSVTFIGNRDSVDGKYSLETHILSDIGNIEVLEIEVCFVEFIRNIVKFNTLQDLKKQIFIDINNAKDILKKAHER